MASSSGVSKRRQKLQAARDKRRLAKTAKKDEQDAIRGRLPFDLPPLPRITIYQAKFGPRSRPRLPEKDWAAVGERELQNIPHSSAVTYAGIPNPNFRVNRETPRFAAVRLPHSVSPATADALEQRVVACKAAGMKWAQTKSHGTAFQQVWLGFWRKYANAPFLTASSRQTKASLEKATQGLMREVDRAFAEIAQTLRKIDPDTYNRTRVGHGAIHKAALRGMDGLKGAAAHNEYFAKRPDRARTSSSRIGGLGSMLAVSTSTAQGTAFHYDVGDDGHVYSVILVLKTKGTLHLPETGYKMEVKVGDAVCFLANQQLHRLDVDQELPGSEQLVFTLWTDKNAMQQAHPSQFEDFYDVLPDSDDAGDEEGGDEGED